MTMEDKEIIEVKSKGGGSLIKHAPLFSSDGRYLFIFLKNLIQSYNVETGERVAEFTGCDNMIIGATLNPQNPMLLVACSISGEIAVWKWQSQLLLTKSTIKNIDKVKSFCLLRPNDNSENTECEALLYYSKANEFKIGLFSLENLTLKCDLPMRVANDVISVQVGGQNDSQFVAVLKRNELLTMKLNSSNEVVRCKTKKGMFTTMACHPEDVCVATGDDLGCVLLWRRLFCSGSPAKAIYHWHTLPVNVLTFSQSGTYLYSGGSECVLVKWRLDTLEKDFLPRLSAPILHLASTEGNTHMSISTKNNVIHIIDAKFKINRVIQLFTWAVSVDIGIKVDYRTKSLVLNGNVGNIQFYSPHTKTLLYNLDIVGQNKLTEERNINIPNTNVSKIALTRNGGWLACIEERYDKEIYREIRLKFFQFDETNQQFTLNTSIEYPHEKGVNSLEFQPTSNSLDLLCATTGNDDQFKIWNLVDTTNIYRKSKTWRCSSSAYYKNLPSNSLSFSSDGSLLAVAFGPCLTAWSPDTCDLKCSLVHSNFKETLTRVQFGNVDESHLIVTCSKTRICVWNLLTLALTWTVPLEVSQLCADPLSTCMAVFTKQNQLFVFTPNSQSPIYHQEQLKGTTKIIAAEFVPRITEYSGQLDWHKFSQLYFIDSNQELFCLEAESETISNNALEYTGQPQRSAFSSLIAQTTSSSTKKSDALIHKDTGLAEATKIKQFMIPPVHTLAPMRLLCSSVLRSFVIRNENKPLSSLETTKNVEDDGETEDEDKNDSETEAGETSKRRVIKQLKGIGQNKSKKTDLKSVLSEDLQWTSVLMD